MQQGLDPVPYPLPGCYQRAGQALNVLRSPSGRPVRDEVAFFPDETMDRAGDYWGTSTDSRGRYETDLPPGTWSIGILREDSTCLRLGAIEVGDGETRVLDLFVGE